MKKETSQVRSEKMKVDPITFQVIYNYLLSAAREMGTTMLRTAHSVIFSEGYDFSCAILDSDGELVATANYCPVHLAAIGYSSSQSIMEIGIENIFPGDVIIHNDPYRGGTHITDVVILKPIFYDDILVGFAANRAHQLDMGGKVPGGFAGDATDIFQEGLRIPPVKWYEKGKERKDIKDIFLSNVRLPKDQEGDLNAQLASDISAERRVKALCAKYGVDTVKAVMSQIKDYSERRLRKEIEKIPDGKYSYEDFLENDGITFDPIKVKITVTVDEDKLIVDYTGSSKQCKGPLNATYGVTASSTFNAILEVSDPSIPVNWGAFRPVRIIAPRGSIVNPNYPAPVQAGNTNTSILIVSTLVGALAQAIPDRVVAASGGTCNDFTCGGYYAKKDQSFVYYWFPPTGWGALKDRDGWSAISDPVSNCSDTPIEMIESIYPFLYEKYQLAVDREGVGKFRGGYGLIHQLKFLADEIVVSATADRHMLSPYGLYSGLYAKPNQFLVRLKDSKKWKTFKEQFNINPSKFSNVPLKKGDAIAMITTAGGGYGNPLERDPDRVLEDVEEGLVSMKRAETDYGVIIVQKEGKMRIDQEETDRQRKKLAKEIKDKLAKHMLNNKVVVDSLSLEFRKGGEVESFVDPAYTIISNWKKNISKEICYNKCIKKGDRRYCPWWNEECLGYWGIDVLRKWTMELCPQKQRILKVY